MTRTRIPKIVASLAALLALSGGLVPGAAAQSNEPAIAITSVDSQKFPKVVAYVTVNDQTGSAATGLTKANFAVSEDGAAIDAAAISVDPDASQSVQVVMALDTSMEAAAYDTIKAAADSFISDLGPQDRVAIFTVAQQVKTIQDFTNDKGVLTAAINGTAIQGSYTALNQAVVEAAAAIGSQTGGRKAIMILTNSVNNVATPTTNEALAKAQASHAAVYIAAFGPNVQVAKLKAITDPTGGKSFVSTGPDEIEANLGTILKQLRQGYRITFQSSVTADNAQHDLAVSVSGAGGQATTSGKFTAIPGGVSVTLPNLADGQTVGGKVNLSVQATAPAPVASVEYLLDDQSLSKVIIAPFNFDWDSTGVQPGTHPVTAKVVDKVGNTGQVQVQLTIAKPIDVLLSAPQKEIRAGENIVLNADVHALVDVSKVEWWVDGALVETDNAPPYSLSLDSRAYPVGEHSVIARVQDNLGRQAETSVTFQVLAPSDRGEALKIVIIIGIIATIVAAVIALWRIARLSGRTRQHKCRVEIHNTGNVRSRYELLADDPACVLTFEFMLNGVKLPQQPAMAAQPAGIDHQAMQPVAPAAPNRPATVASIAKPATTGKSTKESAGKALAAGSTIGNFLSEIGYMLPGSLGRRLSSTGGSLRSAQNTADRAERLANRVPKGKADAAATAAAVASSTSDTAAATATPTPAIDSTRQAPAEVATRAAPVLPALPANLTPGAYQTPFVEPGEMLTLNLIIRPDRPYQTQHYTFRVSSRSIEQAGLKPLVENANIEVAGVSWFRLYLPFFLVAGATIIVIALIALLLSGTGVLA